LRAMSLVSVGGGMIDGHVICKCYGLWWTLGAVVRERLKLLCPR
jgi:hypothetical protein